MSPSLLVRAARAPSTPILLARRLSSTPRQFVSTALRWSLIATGGAVWLWQVYEWLDPEGADVLLGYDGAGEYDKEAWRFFDVAESQDGAARTEIDAKDKALFALLKKLEHQPELEEKLGKGHLALWPGSHGIPGAERTPARGDSTGAWRPSFFLNGPSGSCIVDVVFEKNRLAEWTPTSLRVEELARSGNVVLDAEAELPHGLAYVNRLSSASVDVAGAHLALTPPRTTHSGSRRE
ncbi:hypothetical protein KFE25_005931 [Diacronema lutheri]|uniref:Uncharacterized protein n=1 Tax=Diacronema lutheri TaxID=2081491 RepID=A0A8J6CFU5_DIALT|nr:hypothetical protein KFE25_005931 [Diacronema lutheri]